MHEQQWSKDGCIIMSGRRTGRGRSIAVANSRAGTFYLGSIDCMAETKMGVFIAKGLATVIEKVARTT